MKNLNKLAAAVALTFAAGNAAAALTNTGTYGAPSSILFAASDEVSKNTFILDLALGGHDGLNYRSFTYGTEGTNGALSWDLSSFAPFANNGFGSHTANLKWSVLGGYALEVDNLSNLSFNSESTIGLPFTDPTNTEWGALSTGAGAYNFAPQEYEKINAQLVNGSSISGWFTNVEVATGGANVASIAPINGNSFYNVKLVGLGTLIDQPDAPSKTGIGSSDFFRITNGDFSVNNTITKLGTFSLGANNVLSWNSANVAQVPVPAAAWLFLTGVFGLLGLNRRREQSLSA